MDSNTLNMTAFKWRNFACIVLGIIYLFFSSIKWNCNVKLIILICLWQVKYQVTAFHIDESCIYPSFKHQDNCQSIKYVPFKRRHDGAYLIIHLHKIGEKYSCVRDHIKLLILFYFSSLLHIFVASLKTNASQFMWKEKIAPQLLSLTIDKDSREGK